MSCVKNHTCVQRYIFYFIYTNIFFFFARIVNDCVALYSFLIVIDYYLCLYGFFSLYSEYFFLTPRGEFMFKGLKHLSKALELLSTALEHKFKGLEHKISLKGNKKSIR